MHELIKKVEFTKADFDLLHQAIEVFTEHTHSVKAGRGKAIDEIGKLSKTEVGGKFAGIMPDELFEQAKKDFLKAPRSELDALPNEDDLVILQSKIIKLKRLFDNHELLHTA